MLILLKFLFIKAILFLILSFTFAQSSIAHERPSATQEIDVVRMELFYLRKLIQTLLAQFAIVIKNFLKFSCIFPRYNSLQYRDFFQN